MPTVEAYRVTNRGGKGVINIKVTKKNGPVIGIRRVGEEDEIMLITTGGKLIRMRAADVSVIGRATQGVKLVNLDSGDLVMDVARLVVEDNGDALAHAEVPVVGDDPQGAASDGSAPGE